MPSQVLHVVFSQEATYHLGKNRTVQMTVPELVQVSATNDGRDCSGRHLIQSIAFRSKDSIDHGILLASSERPAHSA